MPAQFNGLEDPKTSPEWKHGQNSQPFGFDKMNLVPRHNEQQRNFRNQNNLRAQRNELKQVMGCRIRVEIRCNDNFPCDDKHAREGG